FFGSGSIAQRSSTRAGLRYCVGMGALASSDIERKDRIVSRNPANGEVLGEVPDMGAAEVKAAVARARAAQVGWGALPVRERCDRVARFRDLVVRRAPE